MGFFVAIAVLCAGLVGLRLFHWAGTVHRCARSGRLARLRSLVGERPERVNAVSWAGELPLHLAARGGHVEVVRFLLDSGGEVNATTRAGATPLHFAAAFGRLEVAALLLERGGDESRGDPLGVTPLEAAVEGGHGAMAKLLAEAAASKVRSSA